ncbi:fluoride efflux transporter CrcB [Bacillus cihuensis]|uniref:fluoride efflux transporter CrcB n=1 Tax=Bacillus cihuensis TaxID=1208599 RepID=UPI000409D52D|nr:fluoride efflux transporter CrcB [Bacillus cihuensis]
MNYVAIGVGGVIGAILRYLITDWFISFGSFFAIGILCVNAIGCFLFGYLQGLARAYEIPNWVVMGLGTGLIGAFTTFSTFSMEVIHYIEQGEIFRSFLYVMVSSIMGYFLVYLGFILTEPRKKGVDRHG